MPPPESAGTPVLPADTPGHTHAQTLPGIRTASQPRSHCGRLPRAESRCDCHTETTGNPERSSHRLASLLPDRSAHLLAVCRGRACEYPCQEFAEALLEFVHRH